jgi:hypothetical protein
VKNRRLMSIMMIAVLVFQILGPISALASSHSIQPQLVFDKSSYFPGDTAELAFQLTGIQEGDKTNSVTFNIIYDSDTFELANGDASADIVDGYIPFTTKDDLVVSDTEKKISVMYVDLAKDISLVEGGNVFTVQFKVKDNASPGVKSFTLEPVEMLDTTFNTYTINHGSSFVATATIAEKVLSTLQLEGNVAQGFTEGDSFDLSTLTLSGQNQLGEPFDLTGQQVVWSSSNPEVATVEGSTLTGAGAGTATITASVGDVVSNSIDVTVIGLSTLTLSGQVPSDLEDKSTFDLSTLTLVGQDQLGNAVDITGKEVVWNTSNTDVAVVEGNILTAVNAGTTTITASIGSVTSNPINVTVQEPTLTSLTILPDMTEPIVFGISDEIELMLTGLLSNGEEAASSYFNNVQWTSSDSSVASVSEDGRVTGLVEGTATITAIVGTLVDTAEVTVIKIPTPQADILGGYYYTDQPLVITFTNVEGYDVYYTLDGTVPTKDNGTLYSESGITIDPVGDQIVMAIAYDSNQISGGVVEYQYSFKQFGEVQALPAGGTYSSDREVTLSASDNPGTVIQYRLGEAGEWTEYTSTIHVLDPVTIYARIYSPLSNSYSDEFQFTYQFDQTYKSVRNSIETLTKIAMLSDTQLAYLVDNADQMATLELFPHEKELLESKGLTTDEVKGVIGALRATLVDDVTSFRTAVHEEDYAYLVLFVNNVKASIPQEVKDALARRNIGQEALLFTALDLLSSGIDFFNVDEENKEKVDRILEGNALDDDKAWLASFGISFENLQIFLNSLTEEEKKTLQSIMETVSNTYVAPPVINLADGLYEEAQSVTISMGAGTVGIVKYMLTTEPLTAVDAEYIWENGTTYISTIALDKPTSGLADYYLYAVRSFNGGLSTPLVGHYRILADLSEVTSVTVQALTPSGDKKTAENGVFYLRQGDQLRVDVQLSQDEKKGLAATIGQWKLGATQLTENDFVRVEAGKYRWIYTVTASDTLAASKVTANIGDSSVQSANKVVFDNQAHILAVFSPQNSKTVGSGVKVTVTALTESTVKNAKLVLSHTSTPITLKKQLPGMYVGEFTTPVGFNGEITGNVEIEDSAGNTASTQTATTNALRITVDSVAPSITSVSHGPGTTFKAGDTINVTVEAGEAGLTVRGNIGDLVTNIPAPATTNDPKVYQFSWVVPQGINAKDISITAIAKDSIGNLSAIVSDSVPITIDTNKPVVDYSIAPNKANGLNGWYVTSPVINLTLSEQGTVVYTMDDGAETELALDQATLTRTISVAEGTHVIKFKGIDAAGNESAFQALPAIKVDTTEPTVTLNPVQPDPDKNPKAIVSGTVDEKGNKVEIYKVLPNGKEILVSQPNLKSSAENGTFTSQSLNLTQGVNNFAVKAYDQAGNVRTVSLPDYDFDNKGPEFKITVTGDRTVTVEASEKVDVGFAYQLKIDGTLVNDFALTLETEGLKWTGIFPEGSKVDFTVQGKDANGNQGTGIYTATNVIASQGATFGDEQIVLLIPENNGFSNATGEQVDQLKIEMSTTDLDSTELDNQGTNVTKAVDFRPDGTIFEQEVNITIPYDPNIVPDNIASLPKEEQEKAEKKIRVLYYNTSDPANPFWEDYTDKIVSFNHVNHLVTFKTNHFSSYGTASDTTPPGLTITGPVNNSYTSGDVTVTGETEANATISIYKNGENTTSATGTADANGNFSLVVSLTQNMENALEIHATDAADNTTVETLNITHDNTAPVVTITSPDNNVTTNQSSVEVAGTVNEANLNQVEIIYGTPATNITVAVADDGTFSASVPVSGDDGPKVIKVIATDLVAQEGSAEITVNKDTTSSTPKITSPANGTITAASSITVTGTADQGDDVNVLNASNGDQVSGVASNGEFSVSITLQEGTNNLQAYAVDGLGNTSSYFNWSVEQNQDVPTVTMDQLSSYTTNQDTVTITGAITSVSNLIATTWASTGANATEDQSGEFTTDNGAFSITVPLQEGNNEIVITAVNQAGSAQASLVVTKDTTPLDLTFDGSLNNSYTSGDVTVTGTTDANAMIRIHKNGEGTPSTTGTADANGNFSLVVSLAQNTANVLQVHATDAAGNTSMETLTITHDNIAPVVGITSPANQLTTNQGSVEVTGTVNEANLSKVQIIYGTPATSIIVAVVDGAFSASVPIAGEDGSKVITVVATDQVGLTGTVERTVLKDTTSSTPTVASPANGTVATTSIITVRGTADINDTVYVKNVSTGEVLQQVATSGEFSMDIPLQAGTNNLEVYAVDSLGNTSSFYSWSVEKNNDVPTVTIDEIASHYTTQDAITVTGTINPGKYNLTSATWASTGANADENQSGEITTTENGAFSITIPLQEGDNEIVITADNAAGSTQTSFVVTRDITGPEITVTNYTNNQQVTTQKVTITGTLNEAASEVTAKVGDTNAVSATVAEDGRNFSVEVSLATNASNTITITAKDHLNNMSVATLTLIHRHSGGGGVINPGPTPPTTPEPSKSTLDEKEIDEQLASGKAQITFEVPEGTNEVEITASALSKIASTGKELVIKTDKVTFNIPATALVTSNNKAKVILKAEDVGSNTDKLSQGFKAVGKVYEFTAAEQEDSASKEITFKQPIRVTISYEGTDNSGINVDKLGAYWFNETTMEWVFVGGKVNKQSKTVEFTTDHFSKYTVMEYDKTFTDLQNHWAKEDIELMASKHIVKGATNTTYNPGAEVTRAEFATLIVRALGLNVDPNAHLEFTDVSKSKWYYGEIGAAYHAGIVNGLNATQFGPNEKITREQMAVMVTRAMVYANLNLEMSEAEIQEKLSKFDDSSQIAGWAKEEVAKAVELGVINGRTENAFVPNAYATRAESAVMIKRMFVQLP